MEAEEYSSPSVMRLTVPSPQRPSPPKDGLASFYSDSIPTFVLEAIEAAATTGKEIDVVDLPRHYLPHFGFSMANGFLAPTMEELDNVFDLFPGCVGLMHNPPFLVIHWNTLPPKPWPLTLGGIALFYTSPGRGRPPTYGRLGGSQPILTEDVLRPYQDPGNRTDEVLRHLVEQLRVGIHYFFWSFDHWYAVVLTKDDGRKLPSSICALMVMWALHFDQCALESCKQEIIPQDGVTKDMSLYLPRLRPGVMLASEHGLGSTSGVPVVDKDGKKYFTVACHAFPTLGDRVYHPCVGPDNLIGEVKESFVAADIALVELRDGLTYSTISFDGTDPDGTKLLRLISSAEIGTNTHLYMDSPWNGKCEGIVCGKGIWSLPETSDNPRYSYYQMNMIYFGNGAEDVFPGTCGSCLWTEEREIAGFFRFYNDVDAVAYSPTVDVLITSGFELQEVL